MLLGSGKPGDPLVWHGADEDGAQRAQRWGLGKVSGPVSATAGAPVEMRFCFVLGQEPVTRLAVAWRWAVDWGDLQMRVGGGGAPMQVTAPPGVEMDAQYQRMGAFNPWNHHIDLSLIKGQLQAGDQVELHCGPEWGAPTLAVKAAEFIMLAYNQTGDRWERLADSPRVQIEPGPAVRMVVVGPSQGVVGEMADVLVRLEDEWGNATPSSEALPELQLPAGITLAEEVRFRSEPPVYRARVRFEQAGRFTLGAEWAGGLQANANPLEVYAQAPERRLFWGDLHSGQSDTGCGAGSLDEHFAYGRWAGGLQFATQQANDHYVRQPDWQAVQEATQRAHEDGAFVAFLGCEWSPHTEEGGDRNVIWRGDQAKLYRSDRFYIESQPDPTPDAPTAPQFHRYIADQEVLLNLHVGGRPTNLGFHQPESEKLAEIHSTHGTSEWFFREALQRGYRVGVTAGADGVMTRPGADHPGRRLMRNVRSGLTGVYARQLSREALWEAFAQRCCFATTGERITLWSEVDGHPMGAECDIGDEAEISLEVTGTAALERVEIWRGTQVMGCWQVAPQAAAEDGLWRLLWGGAQARGTAGAQRVIWDGSLNLENGRVLAAAPVGFHSPCDGIELVDQQTLRWRSATAGNWAGAVLRVEGGEQMRARFESGPCNFTFSPVQVRGAPMRVEAGGLDRAVEVGPAPRDDGPSRFALRWRDTQPLVGMNPYWVRVIQVDQARAWSSPVYARRRG
ncbi:MAG: DUF3604 domain-containing protein [Candidatus Latescibacteria bacterium]|nr:DUF3604 domain-containing protein [Candidatus Latescibacterota bacterium]